MLQGIIRLFGLVILFVGLLVALVMLPESPPSQAASKAIVGGCAAIAVLLGAVMLRYKRRVPQ